LLQKIYHLFLLIFKESLKTNNYFLIKGHCWLILQVKIYKIKTKGKYDYGIDDRTFIL